MSGFFYSILFLLSIMAMYIIGIVIRNIIFAFEFFRKQNIKN